MRTYDVVDKNVYVNMYLCGSAFRPTSGKNGARSFFWRPITQLILHKRSTHETQIINTYALSSCAAPTSQWRTQYVLQFAC